jgi:Protein of unknown function (DUF3105)
MPPKPRSKGGRKPPPSGGDRRTLVLLGVGGLTVLVLAVVGVALVSGGGSGGGGQDARAALEQAGCTLSATPSLAGDHSVATPSGTSSKWNTDPPTSGPHYQIPAVYGVFAEPVYQAQLVHNLEHGAIGVQYGSDVPQATVDELETFVKAHARGSVLAPFPSLGDKIALGAWVVPDPSKPAEGTAYLAKCTAFDETAFAAYFDAYQFQGPERFPPNTLLPGSN